MGWVVTDLIRPVCMFLCWICERSDPNLLQPMGKKLVPQTPKKTAVLNILLTHKSIFFISSHINQWITFPFLHLLNFIFINFKDWVLFCLRNGIRNRFLGIGFLGNFIKYVWLLFNFPRNYMYTVSYHGKD